MDAAAAVAAEVHALGRRAVALTADAADRGAVEQGFAAAERALGPVSIVVANIAAGVRKPFLDLSEDDFRSVLAATVWAVFHALQVAARRMIERRRPGSLVVISSVHATMPFKNAAPYNAAKAAVNALARTVANELAPDRIRVNVVEPGLTDTPGQRRHT